MPEQAAITSVVDAAARTPGLDLLLLFGSRARGDGDDGSDWDIGYMGDAAFDPDALLTRLVVALQTDRVDLVDLARAGGLLRFRAARDGRLLFEARSNVFAGFWLAAVSFWCEAAPLIERGYDALLSELPR